VFGRTLPYAEHPVSKKPDDVNQKIWRYLDFKKYADLLDKEALFFARLDKLGEKFEGSITRPEMDLRQRMRKTWVDQIRPFIPELTLDGIMTKDSQSWENFRRSFFVNCWHMNEHESNAMWQHYSKNEKNVAVQSTYRKLQESLDVCREHSVWIGKVVYKDLTTDISPFDNAFHRYIRKDVSFEHERELRAVILKMLDAEGNILKEPLDHIYASVNLNTLIAKVVVSPLTSPSFLNEVRLAMKKHHIDKSVEQSKLATKPLF
jgi:hypothetical protein